MEDRIEATVDDLDRRVAPRILAPGHCTGWRAPPHWRERPGSTGCAPSVVETCDLLSASEISDPRTFRAMRLAVVGAHLSG